MELNKFSFSFPDGMKTVRDISEKLEEQEKGAPIEGAGTGLQSFMSFPPRWEDLGLAVRHECQKAGHRHASL